MPLGSQSRPNHSARNSTAPENRWINLLKSVSICGRLLRRSLAQQTERWKLSDTEFLLLWFCSQTSEMKACQNELATAIGISPGQISGLIDRLRQRGLLEAKRCDLDRRRQFWKLTDEGNQLIQQILPQLKTFAREFDEQLSVDDQGLLKQLIQDTSFANEKAALAVQNNIALTIHTGTIQQRAA